jgi:hypothetical protein
MAAQPGLVTFTPNTSAGIDPEIGLCCCCCCSSSSLMKLGIDDPMMASYTPPSLMSVESGATAALGAGGGDLDATGVSPDKRGSTCEPPETGGVTSLAPRVVFGFTDMRQPLMHMPSPLVTNTSWSACRTGRREERSKRQKERGKVGAEGEERGRGEGEGGGRGSGEGGGKIVMERPSG